MDGASSGNCQEGKEEVRGNRYNLLRCKTCGVETTYGNGWAFLSDKDTECSGKTADQYPKNERYKFLTDHRWEKVGIKE